MATPEVTRIALAGDVMIGRGVDQIMRHPGDPVLHEEWARSALRYVELAEAKSGRLPRGAEPSYVWGETLQQLEALDVDVRIVNLETAVTARGTPWPGKGIHYRAHPQNADCLVVGDVDVVSVANNHLMDWSEPGLFDTLDRLDDLRVGHAGGGRDVVEAWRPALVETSDQTRVAVLGLGARSSGIPAGWAARSGSPGVALVESLSESLVRRVEETLHDSRRPNDVVVVSIHWGANWGYRVASAHRRFARDLIDHVGVDVVHGHSSHHPLGLEMYRDRLILYGCGDLVTDYEGIAGHEEFRPELSAWYVVDIGSGDGGVRDLRMIPTKLHQFRLTTPDREEMEWLARTLEEQSAPSGIRVDVSGGLLVVDW